MFMLQSIRHTLHLGRTCPCDHLVWDILPLLKAPAGASHLLRQDIRGESSVSPSILATPLIINWNRPNSYGQGNKTEQDTSSNSAPCYHRLHAYRLAQPCTVLKPSDILYTRSLLYRTNASNSRAEQGSSQTSSQSVSAGGLGLVSGHKDIAEKSSFLPAEGSGTHEPASKRVRLYCKRCTQFKTKPRVQ